MKPPEYIFLSLVTGRMPSGGKQTGNKSHGNRDICLLAHPDRFVGQLEKSILGALPMRSNPHQGFTPENLHTSLQNRIHGELSQHAL